LAPREDDWSAIASYYLRAPSSPGPVGGIVRREVAAPVDDDGWMATERSSRWYRVLDLVWLVLLLGAAVAIRQSSVFFQVPAIAVLIVFLGWQTVAKLTRHRTPFDTANAHIGFFLFAALMVVGGGAQVFAPLPSTTGVIRVLGGILCLAGVVMIAAEARDFEPWLEECRVAREERRIAREERRMAREARDPRTGR